MKIVTLTRPAVYACEGVRLIPGENLVSDADIARLTANPMVRRDISAGIILIGHGAAEPEPEPQAPVALAPEPEPVDPLAELRALAAGDGRRAEVREARAKLAEIEGDGA
jgi:hypothetical protein